MEASNAQLVPTNNNFWHPDLIKRLITAIEIVKRRIFRESAAAEVKSNFLLNFYNCTNLGSGSFGTVFKVKKKQFMVDDEFDILEFQGSTVKFQEDFAIKIIPNYDVTAAANEIKSLSNLIHPHIVSCYNAWEERPETVGDSAWTQIETEILKYESKQKRTTYSSTENARRGQPLSRCLFLQYELCSGGTLEDLVNFRNSGLENQTFPLSDDYLSENRNLFMQILEGLVYLQLHHVTHGDLKLNNIFIDEKHGVRIAKLGDFGLSSTPSAINDYYVNPQQPSSSGNRGIDRHTYLAPELSGKIRTHKGDMYAFGLIYLSMFIPFKTPLARKSAVINAMDPMYDENDQILRKYPELLTNYPREMQIITKMIDHDPSIRPSAKDLSITMTEEYAEDYTINYGNCSTLTEKSNVIKLASFGLSMSQQKADYKKGYRYLTQFLYKYLQVFQSQYDPSVDPVLCNGVVKHLSKVSLELGRFQDDYYRLGKFVNVLKSTLGEEDLSTLKFEFKLIGTVMALLTSEFFPAPGIIFETSSFWVAALERIISSPTYVQLDWKDPWKLDVEEGLCSLLLHSDENSPDFKIGLEHALQSIEKIIHGRQENFREYLDDMEQQQESGSEDDSDSVSSGGSDGGILNLEFDSDNQAEHEQGCLGTQILRARILVKLDRTEEASEAFLFIFELMNSLYETQEELEGSTFLPNLLAEYALFNISLKRDQAALIYCQASLEIFSRVHGSLADMTGLTMSLVMLYEAFGFKEDLQDFLSFVYIDQNRRKDFFMLSLKEDLVLPNLLVNREMILNEFRAKLRIPSFDRVLTSDGSSSLDGKTCMAEVLNDPPSDFNQDAPLHSILLNWAKEFHQRVMRLKNAYSENPLNSDI